MSKAGFEAAKTTSGPCHGIFLRLLSAAGVCTLVLAISARAQSTAPEQKTITLDELQLMALLNNPTFAQAIANIRAAEARAKQAGLYPNPTVGYQGEQIRGGSFGGGEQGFFVQQEIVLGGKLGLNRKVFEQEVKQARAEADEQKMRVQSNVRMSYIQALAAQQTLELRGNLRELARDAAKTTHELANVGQADTPDILEAEVEEQQADLAVMLAQQSLDRAWKELASVAGNPLLPLARLAGRLEDTAAVNSDEMVEKIVNESPAVKIAEVGVKRAEASLAREKREPVPNLQLRAGMEDNRELIEPTGRPVGFQSFADVGIQIPLFNRNQGNIAAAAADAERARREVDRVKLVLRERVASVVQSYTFSQSAADRYKNQMIPRAQKAYEMYKQKYENMAVAYPQVLIAQRTLMQLEVSYVNALESFARSSLALESYLLTDGLEAPAQPGTIDQPVREINIPLPMSTNPQ